MKDFKERED